MIVNVQAMASVNRPQHATAQAQYAALTLRPWLLLQVSLMVHPDKCSHPQAKDAFEMLNSANTALLSEERRREVVHVLNMAKGAASLFRRPTSFCSTSLERPMRMSAWLRNQCVSVECSLRPLHSTC